MPATVDSAATLLVTGASGQLGQLVLTHLLDTLQVPPQRIIAASRSVDKLQKFADRGVTTRSLDFNDAASVEAAAQGADRALLISGNDIFNRLSGHKTAVTALVKAGVQHILYTSLPAADKAVAFVAADHLATETFIKNDSKVPRGYTFLRNGLYFENDIGSIAGAKHTGKWYSAAQNGKLAGISRDDIALANATALASDNYGNNVYELTGTTGLTIDEIAANVSKALGKSIDVVQVSEDGLAQGIAAAAGFPIELAKAFATFDTNTAQGFGDVLGDDFFQLTGKQPQSHADWAQAHASVFAAL